jgi:hypothetical protein
MIAIDKVANLAEATKLIAGVMECSTSPENADLDEHYDCKSDLERAIELLQAEL